TQCHDEAYAAFTQKYRHTTAARRYTVTSMCHEFQKKQVFFHFSSVGLPIFRGVAFFVAECHTKGEVRDAASGFGDLWRDRRKAPHYHVVWYCFCSAGRI
ncbi:MAG: hypothetical protein FWD61_20075, partial [Phycisphaerales bacterium]|nr:hypothetical protein [Phycisphaerales bacterium]